MGRTGTFLFILCLAAVFSACSGKQNGHETMPQTADPGPIVKAGEVVASPAQGEQAPGDQEAKTPVIVFESTEFDFGAVDQGEKVEHVFKFRNTGNADLHIEKVRSS